MARNCTQLRSVGVVVDETLYKLSLIRSLSTKLDSLSVALEEKIDLLAVKDLNARILREYYPQNNVKEKDANELMFQRSEPVISFADHRKKIIFFYSKKRGHKKANCRKLKAD